MAKNEYTKREKTGEVRFIYKILICLENIINKFERFSHNLTENKKETGMSDKWVLKQVMWTQSNLHEYCAISSTC